MSQWNQGQPGFQYPMQTGFPGANQFQQNPQFQQQNPQFQQPNVGGLVPQPTGFPGQAMMQSGIPTSAFLQPQATGFPVGNFQQSRPVPPPVPPLPAQFQQNPPSFLSAPPPSQPNRLLNASPGFGRGGLLPQATGFPGQQPGGMGMLVPHMTGYVDPRLQMMSQSFMPMSSSAGIPQLQPQPQNLVQSFQEHNQTQRGTTGQQLSWVLTKVEKKSYDNIFRQWVKGERFMSGPTAIEVFGASGLAKDDLARIWTLADIDDRGKLNLEEFHIAMGIIYRRLNGMQLPDQLPRELIPSSRQDLGDTVDRVKELLERETRTLTPAVDSPVSNLKNRSFYGSAPSFESNRDATIYKHTDEEPSSVYKPKWRHVDRDAIRSRDDEGNPSSDLQDLKRRLANTAQMFDRAADADAQRTKEDDELAREMSDLNYRVKRIQEDLDFNSRGTQSSSRTMERRRLERELLALMHERIPEVERKIKDRDERKEREKRQWVRERDDANDRFGRFDRRDDYSRESDWNRPYSREEDRNYGERQTYSRADDRPSSRIDRPYSRSVGEDKDARERTYDRPLSPPQIRSTPPPATSSTKRGTPPVPVPVQDSSPQSLAGMTPEQRRAYTQEQAKRRIQERMTKLGVVSPSTSTLDTSVEDRLQQEKKEAEEKAKAAEKQAEERERSRRERLENEKSLKEGRTTPGVSSSPVPKSKSPSLPSQRPPASVPQKVAPPPPKPRARNAPVPAVRGSVPTPPAPIRKATAPVSTPAPIESQIDPEEEKFRAREEALRKAREDREKARQEREKRLKEMEEREKARLERERALQELEEQEAAAARLEEEQYQQRLATMKAKSRPSLPSTTANAEVEKEKNLKEERERARQEREKSMKELEEQEAAAARLEEEQYQQKLEALAKSSSPVQRTPDVVTPSIPDLPSQNSTSSLPVKSTNPFSRLLQGGGTSPAPSDESAKSPNPWAKPETTNLSIPSPSRSLSPVSTKTSYQTAPSSAIDDDWEDIQEKEEDGDSSDDELTTRSGRADIAQVLFGGIRRPASTTPTAAAFSPSSASRGDGAAPPPPPPPPPTLSPATPAAAVSAAPVSRGALFAAIQGGKSLRPTKTVDKSGPALSGKVIAESGPPIHTNASASPASVPSFVVSVPPETPVTKANASKSENRQSVGWFSERAADLGGSPVIVERFEADDFKPSLPDILDEHPDPDSSLMADIDTSTEYRTRALYAFEGEGREDLSFDANVVIIANPSNSGGDWWYGRVVTSGKSGLFPKTYVEIVERKKARAVYAYSASNIDELSFNEGDILDIVDTSEDEWWKAEQRGEVFAVPAGYLEFVEEDSGLEASTDANIDLQALDSVTPLINQGREIPPTRATPKVDTSYESSSEYHSFDEDEDEDDDDEEEEEEEGGSNNRAARERERHLVLEAAGLLAHTDDGPLPRRSSTKRRPAPAVPEVIKGGSVSGNKDLPPLPSPETHPAESGTPEPELSHEARLDDAYARYEAFKNRQVTPNRLSVVSIDSSVGASSPTNIVGPSLNNFSVRDSEGGRYSGFLNFLRSKTPDVDRDRKRSVTTLNISGPISVQTLSSARQSLGDGVQEGISWASLVDKTVLDETPDRERKRQESIFELIATEIAYVRDLQLIVEVFYSTLLPLLSDKETTVIFANIEDILLINTAFLSSLEQHQKDCRLYIDKIGHILLSHLPTMGVYMEYCVNQSVAIKVLQSVRESKPELAAQLERLREDNPAVRNLDLSSYLLIPMQRITRYPLLVKQILQYTDVGDEHDDVLKARTTAERLLGHINESIREQENYESLRQMSQNLWIGHARLDLTGATRNMGPRRLLKQGVLLKAKSGRKLRALLCSDIMLLTDEAIKSLYRLPIQLAYAQVTESSRRKDETGFQIVQQTPRNRETISLRASSPRDCQQWIQEITYACSRARHAEETAVRQLEGT